MADPLFSHRDNINVTVNLSALPAPIASFGTIVFVDDLANSTLLGFKDDTGTPLYQDVGTNSSKLIQIGSVKEMLDANDASKLPVAGIPGSVSAQTILDITAALSHSRSPDSVYLLSVEVGTDAYDTIFAHLDDVFSDYYAVVPIDRTDANIALVLQGVNASIAAARERVVVAQTADADAYAATWAASAIGARPESERERMFLCFHQDAQPCAAGVASWILSWDPDQFAPPWTFPVPGIAKLALPAGATTTVFKTQLDLNNINHPLPLAGTDVFLDPGKNQSGGLNAGNGRPMYVIVTADWFKARLIERVSTLKVQYASLGQKLPMNSIGQQIIVGQITGLYETGVAAGHFLSREEAAAQDVPVVIRAQPISAADKTAQRLRFFVQVPVLLDARVISIEVNIVQ